MGGSPSGSDLDCKTGSPYSQAVTWVETALLCGSACACGWAEKGFTQDDLVETAHDAHG